MRLEMKTEQIKIILMSDQVDDLGDLIRTGRDVLNKMANGTYRLPHQQ